MAECKGHKTLANGKKRINCIATGTLNRFDYGLKWNALTETGNVIVDDKVDIIIKIALLK